MRKILNLLLMWTVLVCAAVPAAEGGRVYLVLWFDTEDYVLSETNDTVKRLADFLTDQHVRATFRIVGEKARMMEREGRRDVIAALARHEIGFHSNLHSQKPLIDEYEEALGWEDGIREFQRREGPGFDDVRRIFGQVPTNYCQPGPTWAPQSYPALRQMGASVYLCGGRHLGLDGKPFWYGGMLNLFELPETNALRPNIVNDPEAPGYSPDTDWTNLERVKANFRQIHGRMSAQPEGGVVSFMFHPYEFITKADWDIVNFSYGANPPRSEWKLPPLRSKEVSARAFQFYEQLILYMKSFPNVEFVTPSQTLMLFEDAAQRRSYPAEEIARIAARVGPEVTFQESEACWLAPSEVFELLNTFAVQTILKRGGSAVALRGTPAGPGGRPADLAERITVPWSQFSATIEDVQHFVDGTRQVPAAVWLGSRPVPPESYLVALARIVEASRRGGTPPDAVAVEPARLAAARYVTSESSAWQWIVAPRGLQRPNLIALAKLQAWTLKPARLRGPRREGPLPSVAAQ